MTTSLLNTILAHEVFPATGCTEPVACAYAASLAGLELAEMPTHVHLECDPATRKNGSGVPVPNTGGACGNLIAACLGALIKQPERKLEILNSVEAEHLKHAQALMNSGHASEVSCRDEQGFFVRVTLQSVNHTASCTLQGGHTRIVHLERDGKTLFTNEKCVQSAEPDYRDALRITTLQQLVDIAETAPQETLKLMRTGIDMNRRLSEAGLELSHSARQLQFFFDKGYLAKDLFFTVKHAVAAAVDARMHGLALPAMTSGGSGNQGLVTLLTVYLAGIHLDVSEERILRSFVFAHLLNAYTKCFIGRLSPLCGCTVSAGLAAAAAIVFQQKSRSIKRISFAINNVVGDLSGMVCDGAKPGCALKAISSVDSALRSGLMALGDYSICCAEGLLGHSAEETIQNLGRLTREGMAAVDSTVLSIMEQKQIKHPCQHDYPRTDISAK